VALALIGAGCACQQKAQYKEAPAPTTPAPQPAEAKPSVGYGPSYTTFESGGIRYVRGVIGYPSGMRDGSGVLLEKTVPAEVMAGMPFSYEYKVSNLTPCEVREVVVRDTMTPNFKMTASDPKATEVSGGMATWHLGEIPPGGSKTIKVTGTVQEEGTMTTCGWVTYTPVLCEGTKVLKPAIQLTKQMPAEVLVCDPIPVNLTVRNNGSSRLTEVTITDPLPAGLTTAEGQSTLTYKVDALAPGESRQFNASLKAAKTGTYENLARVTTAQGVQAQAKATTVVRAPVLNLACKAPEERYAGRPVEVCLSLNNQGDAPAANTVVEAAVSEGARFQSATEGGRFESGRVVWNLGSVAPKASRQLCATFVVENPGTLSVSSKAAGTCAPQVTASCQTRIAGIPAVLLEVIDLEDPIEVGKTETYEIKVTNQGSAPATNVKIVCKLEEAQQFVSGSGPTAVSAVANTVTMAPLASIPPKGQATWRVVVKALKVGDIRFQVTLTCDQLGRTVEETESTNQY